MNEFWMFLFMSHMFHPIVGAISTTYGPVCAKLRPISVRTGLEVERSQWMWRRRLVDAHMHEIPEIQHLFL